MDHLLRWGVQNSTAEGQQAQQSEPRKDLDPAILDHILGRPDAELMKESLTKALDESLSEEERIIALDDLEMLVEHIDNANNLGKLQMYEPLQKLLTSSLSDNIKTQALWVIGTAVQNNPAAQKAYLELNPLHTLLGFLSPSVHSSQLRSKAVYTLSGLLKHNAAAVSELDRVGGWEAFRKALEDSDITVRRKTAFLINSLLIPTDAERPRPADMTTTTTTTTSGATFHASDTAPPSAPVHANSHASMLSDPTNVATASITLTALREHHLLAALVHALVSPTPHGVDGDSEGDVDFEEKIAALLHMYVESHNGQFLEDEKRELNRFIAEKRRTADDAEVLGLSPESLQTLMKAVS